MVINATVRTIAEIGIGLVYLVGAIFNSVCTVRHGDKFYGSFAKGALFTPLRRFINGIVIPNSRPFTFLLISFQLSGASAILSRGPFVKYGLFAGAFFCLGAAVVSNVSGAMANLLLAVVQLLLAYSRWRRPFQMTSGFTVTRHWGGFEPSPASFPAARVSKPIDGLGLAGRCLYLGRADIRVCTPDLPKNQLKSLWAWRVL